MNKTSFGMPTLIELDSLESCVDFCLNHNLAFIEINMNMPQFQIDKLTVSYVKEAVEKGIYFTFHLEENFNIADFNSSVSTAYLDTIIATINIAKQIKAPIITMHMAEGIHFKLPEKKIYLFAYYKEHYFSSLEKFRQACEKAIGNSEVKICIENCFGYLPFMKQGIEYLLESRVFGLTFDIGHSHSVNGADDPFIFSHKEKLYHMHIHDAIDTKCHLALGQGQIDLANRLSIACDHNCRCVIEAKSIKALEESISYLKLRE